MAKRNTGSGRPASERPTPRRKKLSRADLDRAGVTREEIIITAASLFCEKGCSPSEIARELSAKFQIEVSREAPYQFLTEAAGRGWLRFDNEAYAPETENRLRKAHPWLSEVDVVPTVSGSDVAYRTAVMLFRLLLKKKDNPEVHIGFSGGRTMQLVAERLAQMLADEPSRNLPKTLWLHALVAGMDVDDPTTDPNAFFTYYVGLKHEGQSDGRLSGERLGQHGSASAEKQSTQVRVDDEQGVTFGPTTIKFVGLHGPAIVSSTRYEDVKNWPFIRDAYEQFNQARKFDILVTGAGDFTDNHSMIWWYDAGSKVKDQQLQGTFAEIKRQGCMGDMFWMPLSKHGPIKIEVPHYHVMSVVESLERLPEMISQGTEVVLAVGPCGICGHAKAQILKTILDFKKHYITRLVVGRSATEKLLELA